MKEWILVISLITVTTQGLFAQNPKPRVEQNDPTKHHQDLTLRVTADEPATFTLPTSNSPVRIDLSALAIGTTNGEHPSPILRSFTVLYASLTDSIFIVDGNDPPQHLAQSGVSFTNQPGPDSVRLTLSIAPSAKGIPKQLDISTPVSTSGVTLIEVRVSLWY